MNAFNHALAHVLRWEGGYVHDPHDPGGETNYGISKKHHPDVDVQNISLQQVQSIYYNEYWKPIRGNELPPWLAIVVFDIAVNQGVKRAGQILQRAVGVKDDGVIGPETLAAVGRKTHMAPRRTLRKVCVQRVMHYTSLGSLWDRYGKGWMERTFDTMLRAVEEMG